MVLVALHRPPQHSYPVGAALSRVYLRPRPSSSCTKCGCRYHGVGHFMCVPVAPPPGVNLRPVKPVTVEDVQKVRNGLLAGPHEFGGLPAYPDPRVAQRRCCPA